MNRFSISILVSFHPVYVEPLAQSTLLHITAHTSSPCPSHMNVTTVGPVHTLPLTSITPQNLGPM
jgi:hypothetical protein